MRAAAAIIFSTPFLAPEMRTVPDSGWPPVITNFCMDRCSLWRAQRARSTATAAYAPIAAKVAKVIGESSA